MDSLTFISKIVDSLAWPGALITLIVILRKELPAIAKSLRRFKYKDLELEFGAASQAIASEVKQAVPETTPEALISGQPKSDAVSKLEAIAELAPRAGILEAWLLVEAAAADVIRSRMPGAIKVYPGPLRLRDGLQKEGILNARQLAIFEQLRALRNEAVHVPDAEFTKIAVANYIESAIAMASYLEGLATQ